MIRSITAIWIFLFLLNGISIPLTAQNADCIFKDTLFNIDFGSSKTVQEFGFRSLVNYERDYSNCPADGFFSYAPVTSDCFNRDWITLTEDHTPGDKEGKMMLVNASPIPGPFFNLTLSPFKSNTRYQLAAWLLNLCRPNGGCPPLPPDILIRLETPDNRIIAEFETGQLPQVDDPHWRKYFGFFTTPANVSSLTLIMIDLTEGGCGNDFAMDDITIRECYKPEPLIVQKPPKQIIAAPPVKKQIIKKIPDEPQKNTPTGITKSRIADDNPVLKPAIKAESVDVSLPKPILTRENPVIKKIETPPGDLLIQVYDNGEIDGDTVSIYHNNQLIISRAGLSDKPITFHINIDPAHPHHELVMVAENLGSIPPNTSLMIVTAKDKRYEIFISSTEQTNAKIIFDMKE